MWLSVPVVRFTGGCSETQTGLLIRSSFEPQGRLFSFVIVDFVSGVVHLCHQTEICSLQFALVIQAEAPKQQGPTYYKEKMLPDTERIAALSSLFLHFFSSLLIPLSPFVFPSHLRMFISSTGFGNDIICESCVHWLYFSTDLPPISPRRCLSVCSNTSYYM